MLARCKGSTEVQEARFKTARFKIEAGTRNHEPGTKHCPHPMSTPTASSKKTGRGKDKTPRLVDVKPAPLKLEAEWTWLAPLLSFKNPRRYFTTKQVASLYGCDESHVIALVRADELTALPVGKEGTPNKHYRYLPLPVIMRLIKGLQGSKALKDSQVAALGLCYMLLHHMAPPARRILRTLIDALSQKHEDSAKAIGLQIAPVDEAALQKLCIANLKTPKPAPLTGAIQPDLIP